MSRSFRVLVVEDEPTIRDFLTRLLASYGYAVTVAEDGLQGLAAIRGGGIDLIVTDINMPHLGGLEMMEIARREGYAAPCMIVSAFLSVVFTERARELGVHAVLEKPPLLSELRENLRQMEALVTG